MLNAASMGRGKRNGFPNALAEKVQTNSVQLTVPKCKKDGAGHRVAQRTGNSANIVCIRLPFVATQ